VRRLDSDGFCPAQALPSRRRSIGRDPPRLPLLCRTVASRTISRRRMRARRASLPTRAPAAASASGGRSAASEVLPSEDPGLRGLALQGSRPPSLALDRPSSLTLSSPSVREHGLGVGRSRASLFLNPQQTDKKTAGPPPTRKAAL
jgi:hypothetical protein